MTQTSTPETATHDCETPMTRAKQLAERIVASMQAQGYRDIEYILTECQLKIVANSTGKAPRTQYLSLPTSWATPQVQPSPGANRAPARRFVLS